MKWKLLVGFIAGAASGILIEAGANILAGRPGLPGGEILILPLLALLLVFGVILGRDWEHKAAYNEGYQEGYLDGSLITHVNCRCEITPYDRTGQ